MSLNKQLATAVSLHYLAEGVFKYYDQLPGNCPGAWGDELPWGVRS